MAEKIDNSAAAVVVAGGMGKRMNSDIPKQFMLLCGKPVLQWSLECFEAVDRIKEIVLVLPEDRILEAVELLKDYDCGKHMKIVSGGARRQDSVFAGLKAVSESIKLAAVHDAARPGITPEVVNKALDMAFEHGSAVCAMPSVDTLVMCENDVMSKVVPRDKIFRVQTPQIFDADELRAAFSAAEAENKEVTDESSVMTWAGHRVCLSEGSLRNMKITASKDLVLLEAIFEKNL